MARIQVELPEDLRDGIAAHPDIEWEVVAMQAIRRELGFLDDAETKHHGRQRPQR